MLRLNHACRRCGKIAGDSARNRRQLENDRGATVNALPDIGVVALPG